MPQEVSAVGASNDEERVVLKYVCEKGRERERERKLNISHTGPPPPSSNSMLKNAFRKKKKEKKTPHAKNPHQYYQQHKNTSYA